MFLSQPSCGGGGGVVVGLRGFSSRNHDSGCGVVFHQHHAPPIAAEQPFILNKSSDRDEWKFLIQACRKSSSSHHERWSMATGAVHVALKPHIATALHDQDEFRTSRSSKIHHCLVKS
jgi:hypothetical protein